MLSFIFDIKKYFFEAIISAVAFMLLILFLRYVIGKITRYKRITIKEASLLIADSIYMFYVYYITLSMRSFGSRREVDLVPFHNISPYECRLVIENMILFIPFGILVPLTYHFYNRKCSLAKCLAFSFAVSCLIEIAQFVFRCGKTETTDIVMNVFGAMLGYEIVKINVHQRS